MNRLSARLGIALLVVLAAAHSQLRADYLNWTYTATSNVPGITVGSNTPGGAPTGGASVTLTDYSTPQAGGTSIPVQAYVTQTASTTPVSFNGTPSYNLALTITDGTTHDSGTLNFTGSLTGSLSATSSSLVNTFTPVTSNTLTLDGHTYAVTLPQMTLAAPTAPQKNLVASISVDGSNNGGNPGGGTNPGGGVHAAPEPASLVLGSLGFSCFGLGCWCKRRFARRRPEDA